MHVDSIAIVHTIHRCPKPVFRTHKDSATAESYLICTRSWTSLKLSQQNIKGRKHLDTEMETTTVALASLPSVYHLFTAVLISPVQSIVHSTVQSRVQSPESNFYRDSSVIDVLFIQTWDFIILPFVLFRCQEAYPDPHPLPVLWSPCFHSSAVLPGLPKIQGQPGTVSEIFLE